MLKRSDRDFSLWPQIEKILLEVERPSRYINREWGAIHKSFDEVKLKIALSYPDLYEVGMSHLGLQILYDILNKEKDVLVERVFAPGVDLEEILRRKKIPLFTLESHQPASSFDVFGFSLQTEMTYTNILNMLDLAGIPLYASERDDDYPLIIGGGPAAFTPEPLAEFFDLFVIGEAEEAILELAEEFMKVKGRGTKDEGRESRVMGPAHAEASAGERESRDEGRMTRDSSQGTKEELLKGLVKVPGIYVPSFYNVSYDEEGKVKKVAPNIAEAPPVIIKRAVSDLDKAPVPTSPIVPFMNVIHQRATLEVMRGCTRGCRFCQAGIIYRPTRERSLDNLSERSEELLKTTGHEEISLASLSTSDFGSISILLERLVRALSKNGISISLPSLRMDSFSLNLANQLGKIKKTGLTFAPEAGTQRLRRIINKDISEEDLLKTSKSAFEAGWDKLKLYFMFGLPYEKGDDLEGIVGLSRRIVGVCLETVSPAKRGRVKVAFNVSPFVPKAHTPFQWVAQNSLDKLLEKQKFLKRNLRGRHLLFKTHDISQAIAEGALARGDRRVSQAIKRAWELGAKFDAWKENFDFNRWEKAFQETGLSLDFYTTRKRFLDETFPWDHISSGVTKEFLWEEYERAKNGDVTPDCKTGSCTDCNVCLELGIPIGSFAS